MKGTIKKTNNQTENDAPEREIHAQRLLSLAMRSLMLLAAIFVTTGCGKNTQRIEEPTMENVAGTYVGIYMGDAYTSALRINGVCEDYVNDVKTAENKWSVLGSKVHVVYTNAMTGVFTIEPSGDLTLIGWLTEGNWKEARKEENITFKKTK